MSIVQINPDSAIFNEAVLNTLKSFTSFESARAYIADVISSNTKARPANIQKATKMLNSCNNLQKLQFGCYDFFLAHQGNKVIK